MLMSLYFQELDYAETRLGALSLRRRRELPLGVDVYEIKLDEKYLMSSLFTAAEVELARLALRALPDCDADVLVGGLGLGYTAQAVLEHERVRSVVVVEALAEVISWHKHGLLPLGPQITSDARSRLVHGDFFAMLASPDRAFDAERPARRFHAILVDIDHSPSHLLDPSHAALYSPAGLRRLAGCLQPGGVFGLWSNDPPDAEFQAALEEAFESAAAHVVAFPNHQQDRDAANTVYVARTALPKA